MRKLKIALTGAMEHRQLRVAILVLAYAVMASLPQRVLVMALVIACLVVPFVTIAAEFVLVTFSPLRKVPQPKRSLLMGFGGGAFTGVFWLPAGLSGGTAIWIALAVVGITSFGGALIGLFGSAETISAKMTDEVITRRDHGQFYGGV